MTEATRLLLLFVAVLAATLALGGPLSAALRRVSFRQHAYEDAPKSHAVKSGTPTMGGLLFALAIVAAAACHPDRATISLAALGLICGSIGFVDDYMSIRRGRNRGLRARDKFALTLLAGIAFLALAGRNANPALRDVVFTFGDATMHVPHAIWYLTSLLVILATTHAVNLTDGLDGLAAGTVLPPLAVFAWLGWHARVAGVTFVDVALAAAVIGFLAFNRHPARVFMGDTGALALGAIVAGSAISTGTQLLLPLGGGGCAIEALSVILQVTYFKATRRRIFRMSPLHHHFELGGWPETKVTTRFWTASALLSLAGAAIAR
ncbi:MAG: phospho-N-acetylmuramoyl-pentapeptide-transferase [Candidatus Eremiobacteraeota bacterium]|nr:phospho-N-acetylmuramoyl-pentapeptide-transferase [Candidatus Eremiobacteraeota bacterium]